MRTAVVTGIGGQDGRYLASLLDRKGYNVVGLIHDRHPDLSPILRHLPSIKMVTADLTDLSSLANVFAKYQPDEVYNLGAQSGVDISFSTPIATANASGIGPLNCLEALRVTGCAANGTRFFQASSSEMFGDQGAVVLSEDSALIPRSPYAVAKTFAHQMARVYRDSYGIYAATGISFNHESPHRGEHFVTRKISLAVARISAGIQSELRLGNLESCRDWGFAGDYVEGMWRILQHGSPEDFVLATGETYSVRDFLDRAFACVGINDWEPFVVVDPAYMRPNDVSYLCGNSSKARDLLGWSAATKFDELVSMMVEADVELLSRTRITE